MKQALLLVNLGTPEAPTRPAVKAYLKEFLMDPHVIDIPIFQRFLLVYGIIAPFRSGRSAKAYSKVWMDEGSPLLVYSKRQQEKIQALVGDKFEVKLAMRYGRPALHSTLDELRSEGFEQVLVIPMYPQFADSSTGSILAHLSAWKESRLDELEENSKKFRMVVLRDFAQWPPLIEAMVANIKKAQAVKECDHVLISFHSIPERHLVKDYPGCADCLRQGECPVDYSPRDLCYRAQCFATVRAIVAAADLKNYSVSFQSKLGREPWLTPATDQVLLQLAAEGKKNIAVICPSFVADCLETLEEIQIEGAASFIEAGGESLTYIPCPNDSNVFASGIAEMTSDWLDGNNPSPLVII